MAVSIRKDIRLRTLAEENGSPTRKDIILNTQAEAADTGAGGSGSGAIQPNIVFTEFPVQNHGRHQPRIRARSFPIQSQGLQVGASSGQINYKTGSFILTAGSEKKAVRNVGFTPKAIIPFATNSTATEDTLDPHGVISYGFSDGTNHKSVWAGSQDNVSTDSNANRYANSSKVIMIRDVTDGSLDAEAELSTFDSDGFTLNWTTNTTSAQHIKYIAIGGGANISAEVGSFTQKTSTGSQSVSTGLSNANFAMFLGTGITTEDSLAAECQIALGMATSSTREGLTTITSEDATATISNSQRYQRTDRCFAFVAQDSTTIQGECDFTNFTASGFDLNWSTSDGTARDIYYLTIKGGQWQVGNGTSASSAVPPVVKTFSTDFQPKGMGLFSYNQAALTTVRVTASMSIGASDGTDDMGIAVLDLDANDPTDTAKYSSSTKCHAALSSTSATFTEGELDSFNSGDFKIRYTKIGGTELEFIWFVCGDEA